MPAPSPADRQSALSALYRLSQRDLANLWRKLNLGKPDKLADPLTEILDALVNRYGSAAASLTADWYDEARADAGAAGRFSAIPAEAPATNRLGALSRWGVTPLFGASPNGALALSLISGGMQRLVAGMSRDTTIGSVGTDPGRPTYARHASANACAFCAMLASRGAVYSSASNARTTTGESLGGKDYTKIRHTGASRDSILAGTRQRTIDQGGRAARKGTTQTIGEKYHDDCHCTEVVVWPGQTYEPAPYVKRWEQAYVDASGASRTKGEFDAIDVNSTLSKMREALGTN